MADTFEFDTARLGDIELHYASCGARDAPLFLFLHGFPEYWVAWKAVMPHFAASHFCVAPDQRGYNLSSKPEGVESYAVGHLVEDIRGLADKLSPGARFLLAGHDWGASAAYAFAMRYPERLSGLIIANGVHPGPFQDALLNDPEQIEASQYFHLLRSDKAERVLSENGYARLFKMLAGSSEVAFLDEEMKAGYAAAWSRSGALTGMVNWYRASPIHVPVTGETPDPGKALKADPARLAIRVPHLLIHGIADRALRPSAFRGIEVYAPDLQVHEVAGTGHWILHEKPDLVVERIARWIAR